MKTSILRIMLMACMCVPVSSCYREEAPSVSIDVSCIESLRHTGQTVKVPVKGNTLWTASCDSSFVMIAPDKYDGNCKVSITVPSSNVECERVFRVAFVAQASPSDSVFLKITQNAIPYIHLSETELTVPGEGGSAQVCIHANEPWVMQTAAAKRYADFSPSEGSGDAVVTITMPETTKTRKWSFNATFQLVSDSEKNCTLKVYQEKKL